MNDNQIQKKANVPTLRFPEFSGEWSHGKLSDYLAVHPERNNNSEFSKEEVLSVSGDSGVVNQIELLGRSFAGKDVSNYHVVRKGNIIYTKSPLKEFPYGIVKMNKGDDGIVSTLYAVYDVEPTSRGEFIEQYFAYAPRANRYFKPIVRIGAKQDMKIGHDEVLDNVVVFPSISEQNKIADFLNIIDERISIQNKIIERYQSLIRALYARMLGKMDGEKYALGQLVTIRKGQQVNGEFLAESGTYKVLNGGINPSGYLEEYNTPSGTISISEGGNSCGYVQFNSEPFWSGGHCYTLESNDEMVNYLFLYHYLKFKQADIMALRIGSGLPNVQKKDLEKFEVIIPDTQYQNKATSIFSILSEKIELEQYMLGVMNEQKAYLLRQLFI